MQFADLDFNKGYKRFLSSYSSSGADVFELAPKLSRATVFPHALFLLFLIVGWVLPIPLCHLAHVNHRM